MVYCIAIDLQLMPERPFAPGFPAAHEDRVSGHGRIFLF